MRRLLIGLAILVAFGAAVDWFVKQEAESRIATEVAAAYDINKRPDVSIDGFPFILNAVRGRFPAVMVSVDSLQKEGMRLDDFEARLEDLRFEPSAVISGKGQIEARRGSGTVMATLATVNQLIAESTPAPFELVAEGNSVVATQDGRRLSTTVEIVDGVLVVSPEGLASVSLDLPQIASGVTFRGVDTTGAGLLLRFSLDDAALQIAG